MYSEFHKRHGVYKSPNFFLLFHFYSTPRTCYILYPLCLGMTLNSFVVSWVQRSTCTLFRIRQLNCGHVYVFEHVSGGKTPARKAEDSLLRWHHDMARTWVCITFCKVCETWLLVMMISSVAKLEYYYFDYFMMPKYWQHVFIIQIVWVICS